MNHPPAFPGPDPIFDQIDAYLDDALAPADRAAFEARLNTDASLRAELDLARGIEASLNRTHVPESLSAPSLPSAKSARAASAPQRSLRRFWPLASAAAIVLVALAGYLVYDHFDTSFRRYDPARFYAMAADHNFAPDWTCQNDDEFKDTTRNNVGQAMLVHQDPTAKIQLVGWAYSKTYRGTPLGPKTIMLFAKVDSDPVIVLVDELSRDAILKAASDPKLHVFRRELGSVVLYEITPRSSPVVMDAFYMPPSQ